MPDEKRIPPEILKDVNPSELGQLSPGYTPYNPELQSWNREKALGRGGSSYQTQKSSSTPEFTALESDDLIKAARESAEHLEQSPDITKLPGNEFIENKLDNLANDKDNSSNIHEDDKNRVHNRNRTRDQKEETDHER